MRIGVLALQGGYSAHMRALALHGYAAREVRVAKDTLGIEGLVLPGGESTVQARLLERDAALREALQRHVRIAPTYATCAGVILASSLGWLDVVVERNAYGPQVHSGEYFLDDGFAVLLIRAPRICGVGAGVEVLATLGGDPALVREGPFYGVTYHPELVPGSDPYAGCFRAGKQ